METVREFDILDSPLEGTNLIEAGAGTGKTYAITGLFLRLILEKNFSASQILVVTFTEAATAELKERIRVKLREAADVFSTGRGGDSFLNGLVKKMSDPAVALTRLHEALRIFDQAGIFTIHGFCRKTLHENAFESGSLFDTELVTDQENLKREITEDFWRRRFYRESSLFVNYAMKNQVSPESLLSLFSNRIPGTDVKVLPDPEIPGAIAEEQQFRAAFDAVRDSWLSEKADIEDILRTHRGLNRNRYRKNSISTWIREMDRLIASGGENPVLFEAFKKFCTDELEKSTKKGHAAPGHPFFYLCDVLKEKTADLQKIYEKRLLGLKADLFHYLQDELARRKRKRNIQFFDDLLLNLHRALERPGGGALARNIRKTYRAALIDEFQDTDPVQYAILKKIFMTQDRPLFLIGDPKQAIYGFRGADIFAYMDASAHVESRYTLKENWRSEPGLITAVNTVFDRPKRPFLYEEIVFHRAAPAVEKAIHEQLKIQGSEDDPAMQVWVLDAAGIAGPQKAINKGEARDRISGAVAGEISRLISLGGDGKARIGDRPLRENDIAVLVRENREARMVQRALSDLGIPSVLYTTDSLFASHEALEMESVLSALARPDNEQLLRNALATDMIGLSGEQIDQLQENGQEWERWSVRFLEYHRAWTANGFMHMFRTLMLQEQILSRLMRFVDGERRSTNVLHLAEVLHRVAVEKTLAMTGLVKWLSDKRREDSVTDEEHQLRLESDENAVRIVTIHRSKGLEYPVVFCPFAWAGSRSRDKKGPFLFHNGSDGMKLTLDLGSDRMEAHRRLEETETLAENLRLLYVALTRAKNRCYLVWGRFNKADTSALAYLFHPPDAADADDIVGATSERFNSLDDQTFYEEIRSVARSGGGTIRVADMPEKSGKSPYPKHAHESEALSLRKFSGTIDHGFRVTSFSSLVSDHTLSAEVADRDGMQGPGEAYPEAFDEPGIEHGKPAGIFSFPRGARAGTFMHDILEHLDFRERGTRQSRALVASKLTEYGFEPEWEETVCAMIRNVLSTPLEPGREDFILARISNRDRLNELAFYFPLRKISAGRLARVFRNTGESDPVPGFSIDLQHLDFSPVRGYMKGFVDMVFQFDGRFYLVDWKSNFLGNSVEDYAGPALARAMKENYYVLQYHIYALALHQYLRLRLPDYRYDRHFGGVFYIFLRGVRTDRGPDYGIFRDRPSEKRITDLCHALINGPVQ